MARRIGSAIDRYRDKHPRVNTVTILKALRYVYEARVRSILARFPPEDE